MDLFKSKKATREHIVNLTKELIKFPSHINEPLKIFELAQFIKSYFAKDSVCIMEHVINNVPALVITTKETKHPHIMLSGHIDVVPSSNIYTPRVEGDLLYGSGSMDMKGGVAVMMALMKYFSQQENVPSIGLMLTSDEETGGMGTYTLLNKEGYHADFCLVGEGRGKYDLVIREKGILVVSIKIAGKSIHSAYPWKGRNVLEDLMKICLIVKSHFPKARDGWVPTVSTTFLKAGQELNTVPSEAEAVLFFRLTGKKKLSKDRIMELLKKLTTNAEIKELVYGDVFEISPKDEYVRLLRTVAQNVLQKKIAFGENHGASDARFFAQKMIPTVVLGPVGKEHHSSNECVSVTSLEEHFEVLKAFVAQEYGLSSTDAQKVANE